MSMMLIVIEDGVNRLALAVSIAKNSNLAHGKEIFGVSYKRRKLRLMVISNA